MTDSQRMTDHTDWLTFARQRRVPFLEHLNIRPVSAENGRAEFEITIEEIHLRTLGILHGGVTASLLDTVVGFAAVTVAPPQHHVVTAQLNMNFVRTVGAGEQLIAVGEVQHAGQRTAVASGNVQTTDGQLVALATATMMYLPIPEASHEEPNVEDGVD